MKRVLVCILSVALAVGLMPAFAVAESGSALHAGTGPQAAPSHAPASIHAQAAPSVPEAHPEAVTGASVPADMGTRDKVYVEDFRSSFDPHYYGPKYELDERDSDASIIETALKAAEGKTLVFEKDKTYTIGTYVRSNAGGIWGRSQGIESQTSDVVIEGNGATLQWKEDQPFVDGGLFVLKGTNDHPIRNVVIRNLNIAGVNNSRNYTDPLTGKSYPDYNVVQLKGFCCENILVENCTFTAVPNPDPVLKARSDAEGRGLTNIWFYGGAKDVTVRNCTLRDVTNGSQESGSNLLFSGECEWKRSRSAEWQSDYEKLSVEEQYKLICDQHLQGRVENILVENNTFEHACHDESFSLWCGEVFKDVLVRNNSFDVHDGDAHVPSTVNFTFGLPAHHDRLENVIMTRNDIYAESSWAPVASRADIGGDLHITDNNLHYGHVPRDRERVPDGDGYKYSPKEDLAVTNGIIYAAYNKDYVDFSGNRVTYDNLNGAKGILNLMGTKNLLCEGNSFISNGPLSYVAVLFASDVADAAGHESVFINNSFDINGGLDKAVLRGSFPFTGNVVRLNGDVKASALFSFAGNIESKDDTKTNRLYTLSDNVSISGNKVFAKGALPKGSSALSVYDATFAGHTIDFTDNELWSTVGQESGDWPLVNVQDVQGQTPTVDATGTTSNLYNKLSFYRTPESASGYVDYQGTLTDPKVLLGSQQYTAESDGRTRHSLDTVAYNGEDPDETASEAGSETGIPSWSEPTYTWSLDHSTCTARRVRTDDPRLAEDETVAATPQATRAATCAQKGVTTYTAAFSKSGFATQVVAVDDRAIDPDAHTWGNGVITAAPTCTAPGARTYTCTGCNAARTEDLPALGHTWNEWVESRHATATEDGLLERSCAHCGETEARAIPATAPADPAAGQGGGATPGAPRKTSIAKASVTLSTTAYTYNGKERRPGVAVRLDGILLAGGSDYEISYRKNVSAGTATVVARGKGAYEGSAETRFTIRRAANPLKVSAKKKAVPASAVADWPHITKPIAVSNAKGALKFSRSDGSKLLVLNKKTGQVTVKRGTPAGTYRMTVKVTATGNANYKPITKSVKATVKVM